MEDALPQCKSPLPMPLALPGDAGLGWAALLQQPSPAGAAWGFAEHQVGHASLVPMSRGCEDCHCAVPRVTVCCH